MDNGDSKWCLSVRNNSKLVKYGNKSNASDKLVK